MSTGPGLWKLCSASEGWSELLLPNFISMWLWLEFTCKSWPEKLEVMHIRCTHVYLYNIHIAIFKSYSFMYFPVPDHRYIKYTLEVVGPPYSSMASMYTSVYLLCCTFTIICWKQCDSYGQQISSYECREGSEHVSLFALLLPTKIVNKNGWMLN